jgi:hypothetical protein
MATQQMVPADRGGQVVRVSPETYRTLKEMAAEAQQPLVRCLEHVVREAYERRLWERYAEANRRLEADADAAAAVRAEEALWAGADADGLDPDEGIEWDESLEDAASW